MYLFPSKHLSLTNSTLLDFHLCIYMFTTLFNVWCVEGRSNLSARLHPVVLVHIVAGGRRERMFVFCTNATSVGKNCDLLPKKSSY